MVRNNYSGIYAEIYTLAYVKFDPGLPICNFSVFPALLQVYAKLFCIYIRSIAEVWNRPGALFGVQALSPVPPFSPGRIRSAPLRILHG